MYSVRLQRLQQRQQLFRDRPIVKQYRYHPAFNVAAGNGVQA